MLKHAYIMRNDARRKLIFALNNGSMTEGQRSKIYDNNFDEFVTTPCLRDLYNNQAKFMGENLSLIKDKMCVALPNPKKTPIGPTIKFCS